MSCYYCKDYYLEDSWCTLHNKIVEYACDYFEFDNGENIIVVTEV